MDVIKINGITVVPKEGTIPTVINKQDRFKSYYLWQALIAFILLALKVIFKVEAPIGLDGLIVLGLSLAVGFGIVNNPSDSDKI